MFLARAKKQDLVTLASELGVEIAPNARILDMKDAIMEWPDYDEEAVKSILESIVEDRLEARRRADELEDRRLEAERQLELERLRLVHDAQRESSRSPASGSSLNTRLEKDIQKAVPKFDPNSTMDIAVFLELYARQASRLGIDESRYVTYLIALLPLDLVQVILQEPSDKQDDFEYIRSCLLEKLRCTPEAYRKKFMQHQKGPETTWKRYSFELKNFLERWVKGLEVVEFEDLMNLLVSDMMKRRAGPDLKEKFIETWGSEKDPEKLAQKFDNYETAKGPVRKSPVPDSRARNPPKFNVNHQVKKPSTIDGPSKSSGQAREQTTTGRINGVGNPAFERRKEVTCFGCGQKGHIRPNCPAKKESVNRVQIEPSVEDVLKPFVIKAKINGVNSECLRDTGTSLDVASADQIPPNFYTQEFVTMKTPLSQATLSYPVARVELEIGDKKVFTKAAVIPRELNLPRYLLGNRTALLLEKDSQEIERINRVITRSMCKNPENSSVEENVKSEEVPSEPQLDKELVEVEGDESDTHIEETIHLPPSDPDLDKELLVNYSRDQIVKLQNECASLQPLFVEAKFKNNSTDQDRKKAYFDVREGLLFRITRDKLGTERKQLCVPDSMREPLLRVVHETGGAHLGVTKCKDRMCALYFWPNIYQDVERYVRSCEPCQIVGKPCEKKKAPLKIVPVIREIFSKINIDACGPLPESTNNNKYMITALCLASKYMDAVPVKDITSPSVIEALLQIFSRIGFPKEIQCDLGRSFTSELTSSFFEHLGIKVTHSSVSHPESNAVERLHRTLKRLLKVMCLEKGSDWERVLPAALFALRTSRHDSTGFTPSELVHGRNLRTPESLLYEKWVDAPDEPCEVTEYVFNLINRLKRCQDLAVQRMEEQGLKRKFWYDRGAVKRSFKPGDPVLVFATGKTNKMSPSWIGPGKVESQLSETNYVVSVPGRRDPTQIYHINMLKPYHQRPERINLVLHESVEERSSGDTLEIPLFNDEPQGFDLEEMLRSSALNGNLSQAQIDQLGDLLLRFQNIFSNEPGLTDLVEHDIELDSDAPLRSVPYRTSPRRTEILREEINKMLKMGIIEAGESEYTSPLILVEAPGKEPRPCVDYRALNKRTKTQFFPLPHIEERVEKVAGAKFITLLDLARGYWQIPLSPKAQRIAAFVTPFGTYRPLRLFFGLVNAPFVFSRLMSRILAGFESFAVPYLDDIAVFSDTWEDHLKHLDLVLSRLRKARLTVKPSKCRFAQTRVQYLGHVVGEGCRSPAQNKIQAVKDFPRPTNKTQVRAFLGLAGYYSHYIKNFSSIAAPLTSSLKGKCRKGDIVWSQECEESFNTLKEKLVSAPVLITPNYDREFIVQVDASGKGIGVVLSQLNDKNEEHPVLFLSKKFTKTELAYSTIEKECAGIIFAIKKLRHYLDGQKFRVITDHNPLLWLSSNSGSNLRLLRWSLSLQPYNFSVEHKAGKLHLNADSLSRSFN